MTIDERLEALRSNIESLHASVHELHKASQRHDGQIAALIAAARQDGENIRALVRIAEIHERRLTELKGGEQ
ncbi:MAG: hypothetical protein C5B51_07260 [Terriglobia bacterium]|nr:MAG: hypothetical protein C5B51_07260 [Terriglobia bacterium]